MVGERSVSVVITTRNAARTIGRCLDSLLPYQRRGLITDVVLVDSHSTDSTLAIAGRYQPVVLQEEGSEAYRDSIIRQYHSTYSALDQGWRRAKGDLVMFLDSDAWVGEGMFPRAAEFFTDPRMAVLGCWQRGHGSTRVAQTLSQLWEFHGNQIRKLQNGTAGLPATAYRFASWFGSEHLPIGGPCLMVRRECLELLNGHDAYGDVGIAARAVERGWRALWWVGAPVYHAQRERIRDLWRERWQWGQTAAFRPHKGRHYLSVPVALGWSLLVGVLLTIGYRNPLHLVVHPSAAVVQVTAAAATSLSRFLRPGTGMRTSCG